MGVTRTLAGGQPTAATVAVGASDGVVWGRYRLRRRLGSGAFGTVWLARDERLERDVAVKLLDRERIASGRFEREARAAARLNHPGVVTLYEAGVDDEGAYLVSELVRGATLARMMQEGQLSDRMIAAAGLALCDALEYAHGQGVVHRDVKPSNVLMPRTPVTPAEMAKLTDFGVARVIGGDTLTRTGDVMGTTAYMSPEQAEGREVQPSADLYSLAVVLYEAMTGVNPLRPLLGRPNRLGTHLAPIRRQRRELPRELACAIDLALRPRPRERGTLAHLRQGLLDSIDQLDDLPGVVEGAWSSPVRGRALSRLGSGWSREREAEFEPEPPRWEDPAPPGRASSPPGWEDRRSPGDPESSARPLRAARPAPGWLSRGLAAGAAAAATAWFAATVLAPSPVLPLAGVLGAGVLVALLPRVGWLALVVAGAVLLLLQHSPGGTVLLVLVALPPFAALLPHPARWPLPALVPALAALGLAGAWPALAGRAPTLWQRLVLGATGWIWLVAGEFLGGHGSYLVLPPATPGAGLWMPSLSETGHAVLGPMLLSGLLLPALIWGAGAAVLPLVARRPGGAVVWALGVPGLSLAVLSASGSGASIGTWPAAAGALVCLVAALLRLPGERRPPSGGMVRRPGRTRVA